MCYYNNTRPINRADRFDWAEKFWGSDRPDDWLLHFDRYYNKHYGILGKKKSEKMNTQSVAFPPCTINSATWGNDCVTIDFDTAYISPTKSNTVSWGMQSTPFLDKISQYQAQNKEEAKETAMSVEMNAVEHLACRVDSIYRELNAPLTEKFNLYTDNTPKNYKELIDFIKNDKFKLNEKRTKLIDAFLDAGDSYEDCSFHGGAFDGIIWDGPQPDRKGYEKAKTDLGKARDEAYDVVNTVSDQEKRLQALKDFQNWKSETAAN